jgi:transposase
VIDEYMTTQCCSNCSKVNFEIKEKKEFECVNCGHIYDRDINSAKNIFMKSLKYDLDK